MTAGGRVGIVAIGRNEGERLKRCLRSLPPDCPVVYVDSGSTDDSVAFARGMGVTVVGLSTERGFTAARARNVGWRKLIADDPALDYIHFIDGDCEMDAQWMPRALAAAAAEPDLCAVFGRLRERHPAASLYNALCDNEWNVPVGLVGASGGIALFRKAALLQADGFNDDIIAGEEPDLCLRLRHMGWKIRRIDAEMALHDAAILHASQFWRRNRRSGHAYAEHLARHGEASDADWRRNRTRIVSWALILPLIILLLAFAALMLRAPVLGLFAGLGLLLYPAHAARIAWRKWREGVSARVALAYGAWLVIGKFAQLRGMTDYHVKRWRGQRHSLRAYEKNPAAPR